MALEFMQDKNAARLSVFSRTTKRTANEIAAAKSKKQSDKRKRKYFLWKIFPHKRQARLPKKAPKKTKAKLTKAAD